MIANLLGSGLGHSMRSLAILDKLRSYTAEKVMLFPQNGGVDYMQQNTEKISDVEVFSFNTMEYLAKKEAGGKTVTDEEKILLNRLRSTSLLINDFYSLIKSTNDLFKGEFCIRTSLLHGDIIKHRDDSKMVLDFKNYVHRSLKDYDIFFHINLMPPKNLPNIPCEYIPIPAVCREVKHSPETVKELLGLMPDDEFVLFHVGGGMDCTMYQRMQEFYDAINGLDINLKIVVADCMYTRNYNFAEHIIRAPFFKNGVDLVNASKLVVTKPGMGIVQDCIVTETPIVFAPADMAERELKVELMRELIGREFPEINFMNKYTLRNVIERALSIEKKFKNKFAAVPKNGADIMAKAIAMLLEAGRENMQDIIPDIKKLSPYCKEVD